MGHFIPHLFLLNLHLPGRYVQFAFVWKLSCHVSVWICIFPRVMFSLRLFEFAYSCTFCTQVKPWDTLRTPLGHQFGALYGHPGNELGHHTRTTSFNFNLHLPGRYVQFAFVWMCTFLHVTCAIRKPQTPTPTLSPTILYRLVFLCGCHLIHTQTNTHPTLSPTIL